MRTPLQHKLLTTSPAGALLVFASHNDFVRETQVKGLGHTVQFDAQGGSTTITWPALDDATVQYG